MPRPYFQRAYNQVAPHPEKNAAPAYTGQGAGSGPPAKNNAAMITPSAATTIWTNLIMVGA